MKLEVSSAGSWVESSLVKRLGKRLGLCLLFGEGGKSLEIRQYDLRFKRRALAAVLRSDHRQQR